MAQGRAPTLERLRDGIKGALERLGSGLVRDESLHRALASGALSLPDLHRQLVLLVLRLVFLLLAEDRDALHPRPDRPLTADELAARRRYRDNHSTARLRRLATTNTESSHPPPWSALRAVFTACERGDPELALPAFGSRLWRPEALPDLTTTDLADADLLAAIRHLCDPPIDWSAVDGEQLGAVHQSLLEHDPRLDLAAYTYTLEPRPGHQRKTSGSYYTPPELVDAIMRAALDPAIAECTTAEAVLALKVCDPACGSGHFLVAAARRLARAVADRTGQSYDHALAEVVTRCLYGVDLDPVAVELCKLTLWLEALVPGRPLAVFDAHIKRGNALFGATPELCARGVPDAAWEPLEGDDLAVARRLRQRNRNERRADVSDTTHLDARACDLWCAAFVWPKTTEHEPTAPTAARHRRAAAGVPVPGDTWTLARSLAAEHDFFHWHLEFPAIFSSAPVPGDISKHRGFDVVLGNPPWDTLSPDAKEFFSTFDTTVRFQDRAGQAALISHLLATPEIAARWARHRRRLYALVHFLKNSGRFRLHAGGNLGKGDLNVYRMFVELALDLVRPGGHVAQLVPDGLYNGANARALRAALFERTRLSILLGLENSRRAWFPAVDTRAKFALYAARAEGHTERFAAAFALRDPEALRAAQAGATLQLPVAVVRRFSADALAVMEFRDQRDIDIAAAMYARWPPLGQPVAGAPHRRYAAELHMGHDRARFGRDPHGLPLYEGRMVAPYDHRAKGWRRGRGRAADWHDYAFGDPAKSIDPQWTIDTRDVPARLLSRICEYRVGFCDVASPTNERSLVAAVVPPHCVCGDKVPTLVFPAADGLGDPLAALVWLAVANSFTMDFLARMKIGLKMSYTVLDSLPFPRLAPDDPALRRLIPAVLALTCTGPEMLPLWDAMALRGFVPTRSNGGTPGACARDQRLQHLAAIEAIVAHTFYGLGRDDLAHILRTFPIVRRREQQEFGEYRSQRLCLEAHDRESVDSPTSAVVAVHAL